MEKHLLVTISEQEKLLYGVQFVREFFGWERKPRITIFYTAPRPPAVWDEERTLDSEVRSEEYGKQMEAKGRKALAFAKRQLVRFGFDESLVETKLQTRKFSKAMDILQEGAKGHYDAVVLGRRGLSRFEEAFDESVSREVLEKGGELPLWVCRRPETGRRNVLVCVDGSENANRTADHVGFILGGESPHGVTLFMVRSGKEGGEGVEDAVFSKCREALLANGLPSERMEIKTVDSSGVAKAILKEAEKGMFAAVAVGRRSEAAEKGFFGRMFTGSVSTPLFKELEGAALWICR